MNNQNLQKKKKTQKNQVNTEKKKISIIMFGRKRSEPITTFIRKITANFSDNCVSVTEKKINNPAVNNFMYMAMEKQFFFV